MSWFLRGWHLAKGSLGEKGKRVERKRGDKEHYVHHPIYANDCCVGLFIPVYKEETGIQMESDLPNVTHLCKC